jgi:hypothetical protein
MFNRTNLTLSARTLSNRLNLGTRSLALNAGANHGDQILRIRQTHLGVMRDGMVWYGVFPMAPVGYRITPIPGSFFFQQQCAPSCPSAQIGQTAVAVRVEGDLRPDDLVDRPERCAALGDPRSPSFAVALAERLLTRRELRFESRPGWKSSGIPGLKRAARRAARNVARKAATNCGKK